MPEFRSGYEDLGALWVANKPSEVEQAALSTLDLLLKAPIPESNLTKIGLDRTQLALMKDVMSSGRLMSIQPVSGQRVAYSPLAIDVDPTAYLQWANRSKGHVSSLIKLITSQQGVPLSSYLVANNPIVADAVTVGVLQPVKINGATGQQDFLFTPRSGHSQEERVILDKARAIVSGVRYGQNFAGGTPIKYPRAILQQLRDHKKFKRGHPDLGTQYGAMVEKLIGVAVDEGNGMWNFHIIDTDENMRAINAAIDMMEMGESPTAHIDPAAQKAILSPGNYLSPTAARPHLAKTISGSEETRSEMLRTISDLARGIIDG